MKKTALILTIIALLFNFTALTVFAEDVEDIELVETYEDDNAGDVEPIVPYEDDEDDEDKENDEDEEQTPDPADVFTFTNPGFIPYNIIIDTLETALETGGNAYIQLDEYTGTIICESALFAIRDFGITMYFELPSGLTVWIEPDKITDTARAADINITLVPVGWELANEFNGVQLVTPNDDFFVERPLPPEPAIAVIDWEWEWIDVEWCMGCGQVADNCENTEKCADDFDWEAYWEAERIYWEEYWENWVDPYRHETEYEADEVMGIRYIWRQIIIETENIEHEHGYWLGGIVAIIPADNNGDFGFELGFNITAEMLASADIQPWGEFYGLNIVNLERNGYEQTGIPVNDDNITVNINYGTIYYITQWYYGDVSIMPIAAWGGDMLWDWGDDSAEEFGVSPFARRHSDDELAEIFGAIEVADGNPSTGAVSGVMGTVIVSAMAVTVVVISRKKKL
jgi:hypothetical protein